MIDIDVCQHHVLTYLLLACDHHNSIIFSVWLVYKIVFKRIQEDRHCCKCVRDCQPFSCMRIYHIREMDVL